ncbi:SIS domain-containing protein [Azospirillum agricola]|uniref:SIS domain-containing protein n=1 Tax=Azospirillum agricola TaxID=1720247 RepID=UPI000A0F2FC3|nr:SIS domain-containing protein [Azospirillum agricola]SMH28802.1 glutamine--fructose-6-phosphate transaminase [Azospirillum lipoferum]
MTTTQSLMLTETNESPAVVAALLDREAAVFAEIARLFAARRATVVTTAARGSSDHAATFFKYLMEIRTGIPVASIGPSVASVYEAPLRLDGGVHVTVSQSGASPDIVALQAAARRGGAVAVAVVNVTDSPLAREADLVLALHAGAERSVAATKSFIATGAALAATVAAVSGDDALRKGVHALPKALAATAAVDSSGIADALAEATSFYTAGRGPGYAIALEAALKAKETAGIHAEAFSLAELMHGPLRLVGAGFPVVAFVPDDAAFDHSRQALERLTALGAIARPLSTKALPGSGGTVPTTGFGLIDPLVSIACYYRMIEAVARRRGFDPDRPANLSKVTSTT